MAIKKVGGPVKVTPVEPVETKAVAGVEGFGQVVKSAPVAQSSATEVSQAVGEVATEIAAGRLADPQDQVDAVIERMVRLQAPEGASTKAVNSRVNEVQLALGDHPGFSARIQSMLADALEANEG